MALLDEPRARSPCSSLACPDGRYPVGRRAHARPRSGSSARSAISTASSRSACRTPRPWLDHGRWGVRASARRTASTGGRRTAHGLRVPAGRGREPAPDPGRPGACRHHRARPFPLHRQRRDRGAPGRAARLCPQGHRGADGRRRRSSRRRELAGRISGDSTVAYALAFAHAVEAALGIDGRRRAPSGCAR